MTSARNLRLPSNGNKFPKLLIICLLCLLGACHVQRSKKQPAKPTTDNREAELNKRRADSLAQVKLQRDQTYTVSMILPFQLNKIDTENLNNEKAFSKAAIALDFYLGARLAADSLASQGMNINLQVFDSKYDSAEVRRIVQKPELLNSDLILGPVYPEELGPVSFFSRTKNILTVFPLSPASTTVYRNPHLLKANNTLEEHTEAMARFIARRFKSAKVVMVRSSSVKENKFAVPFRRAMDSVHMQVTEVNVSKNGKESVKKYLVPGQSHILVIPSTEPAFLVSLLTYLGTLSDTYKITVVGHPSWEDIQMLDVALLQKLNTHLSSSYYLDYKDPKTIQLIRSYRAKYAAEPSEYAVKGFDQLYYFGKLMMANGKNYTKAITSKSYKATYTTFDFASQGNSGYRNRYIAILKFDNYQLVKQE